MGNDERRSAGPARGASGVPGQSADGHDGGVGARQTDLWPDGGGGGYLNECTASEVLEEAKIREFSEMGLPAFWIRVAEAIGHDKFLIFWRMAEAAAELSELRRSENESMIELSLRRYASYKRYQRNRWIEALASNHLPTAVIQQAVKQRLGENLDLSHIRRLAKRGRIPR